VPNDVPQFSLREYGISSAEIPELAERGLDLQTALDNNPVEFTVKDARYVLEQLV
jgi:alcohol dehydrogenase class IV